MLTRRGFLIGAGGLAAGSAAASVAADAATAHPRVPASVPVGIQPAGLPRRQYAWTATFARDADGNPIAPRYNRLLFFDIRGRPTPAHARVLEAALRTLERRYHWGPSGLLFTVAWGPTYFERALGISSPVPSAIALSNFEFPAIDDYDVCLHLACDDEHRLTAVEAALLHGERLRGAHGWLSIASALRWRETRTGFVGAGLPARHQHTVGIPSGDPVPRDAPLFMGFKSGLRKNQATEDAVAISGRPFVDGTTMQVSYMRLRLEGWYGTLNESERVARMYAPEVTPDQVKHFRTDAESDPQLLNEAIKQYGVVGHAQASACARKHGKPRIIRRDFNTVDGGQAGLHFVSIQRTIEDFMITRTAMNVTQARLENPAVGDTTNNGINEFISVLKRGNYIIPSRPHRAFPLLG
jgi:dye decolorizing peroxidase